MSPFGCECLVPLLDDHWKRVKTGVVLNQKDLAKDDFCADCGCPRIALVPGQCCLTCCHASWNLTPTGKISRTSSTGPCDFVVKAPILPECADLLKEPHRLQLRTYVGVDDGKTCQAYSAKPPGEPLRSR